MVNINIDIPDELHREMKIAATISDMTLKAYIVRIFMEEIEQSNSSSQSNLSTGSTGSISKENRGKRVFVSRYRGSKESKEVSQ